MKKIDKTMINIDFEKLIYRFSDLPKDVTVNAKSSKISCVSSFEILVNRNANVVEIHIDEGITNLKGIKGTLGDKIDQAHSEIDPILYDFLVYVTGCIGIEITDHKWPGTKNTIEGDVN